MHEKVCPNFRLVVYDLQKVSQIRLKACKSCVRGCARLWNTCSRTSQN